MNNKEMADHIQKCLEMSSENKITPRNAFALQLIDCMRDLMTKEDFSVMACTLDAGTKIYSNRVDALHSQVMKLANEVIMQGTNSTSKKTMANKNSSTDTTKEQRKAKKSNIIVSAESLRKQLKGKDSRDKFTKVVGMPGEIARVSNILGDDLSISMENNVQFWKDFDRSYPIRAHGIVTLPEYIIYSRETSEISNVKSNIGGFNEVCIDDILNSSSVIKNNLILESDSIFDEDLDVDIKSPPNNECEVDVLSTAMKKLKEEAEQTGFSDGSPSRFEAMKLIFQISSDYHYFDMKQAHYWAGPEFWKRSKSALNVKNKSVTRKTKEPSEITYDHSKPNNKKVWPRKNRTLLTKRTIEGWKRNKLTLPQNYDYDQSLFLDLFHISINVDATPSHSSLETTTNETDKEIFDHANNRDESRNILGSERSLETTFYVGVYEDQLRASEGSEEKDPLNSSFYDNGLIKQLENLRESDNELSNKVNRVEIGLTGVRSNCEFTLVPAPKILRVDPIKVSSKPIRVDMQHLKKTMMEIITRQIEVDTREKETLAECSVPEVRFVNVLRELTGQLERRTAKDLSPSLALMALLTLANENDLSLANNPEGDDVIVRTQDPTKIPKLFF